MNTNMYYLKIMEIQNFLPFLFFFNFNSRIAQQTFLNWSNMIVNQNRCKTPSMQLIAWIHRTYTYMCICELIFLHYPFPRRDTTLEISQLCIFYVKRNNDRNIDADIVIFVSYLYRTMYLIIKSMKKWILSKKKKLKVIRKKTKTKDKIN